tara:strand:+ start:1957 stop:2382 length:426 start_codon:yes stop_codon:yes gene_type:complete
MSLIPEETYRSFLDSMPLLCVDCIIVNESGQYLLVRRINEPLKGEWWTPGGRVYKGETLEEAVRRKIHQELGIRLKNLKPLGYYEDQFDRNPLNVNILHTLGVVFQAQPASLEVHLDDQSNEWKFFENLPERLVIKPFHSS